MGDQSKLELLRLVGERLHGMRWQVPLAQDLAVSDRALRYWLTGECPIPQDIKERLSAVVQAHRAKLDDLPTTLENWPAETAP